MWGGWGGGGGGRSKVATLDLVSLLVDSGATSADEAETNGMGCAYETTN